MQLNQLKNIHHWIRTTDTSEILFVSILVLPLYLLSYNYVLVQLEVIELRFEILSLATFLYAVGIIWMKNSQSNSERAIGDVLVIKNYLVDKGYKYISFERLEKINKRFKEKRIKELVFLFPNEFRLAKLVNDKKGIKMLNPEIVIQDQDEKNE